VFAAALYALGCMSLDAAFLRVGIAP